MAEPPERRPTPLLLRWQGCIFASPAALTRIEQLSGAVLMLLLAGLPFVSRSGLGLEILSSGLLWLLWSLCSPPGRIGATGRWLFLILALACLSTGWSPVPVAAAQGLLKLMSYMGFYALLCRLLRSRPMWWDRLLAALLSGGVLSSVLALRQLYASTEELASWADPGSMSTGTIRIYGPLGNPNLLAGYLLPIVPLAVVAMFRWRGLGQKVFSAVSGLLSATAVLYTYSRGGWLGLLAATAVLVFLLLLRGTAEWPPLWRRLVPLGVLFAGGVLVVIAATQLEPIRTRVVSLVAGRGDSSNNFRINVWLAAVEMIQDRPWLGIGPGNNAFTACIRCTNNPSSTL